MFQSKVRGIIIPQYEHERLAGTFARLWGNPDFARPDMNFDSFVQGVALHDWHYGVIDTLPIGGASEMDWLQIVSRGVTFWFDDPITDIVAKLHIRRLLNGQSSPERDALVRLIDARIAERLPQTGRSREQFEWADKVTRFCDHLAFDFCFEAHQVGTVGVYAGRDAREETALAYEIQPGGKMNIQPWPFSVDMFSGLVIGYQQAGYPDTLTPVIVPFYAARG